jgi:AcrR family transcriptional regulator
VPRGNTREQLLERAVDYVAEHGIADLSLRQLAAALGTSHRILIHHFGSKDGLWLAIAQEVERRQRGLLAEFFPGEGSDPAQAMRAWWRHLSDPALWPNERLFFELYGRALQGRGDAAGLLDDTIDSWLAAVAGVQAEQGTARGVSRAQARLGIAVTRGLLLDLLATGDVAGADEAMEAFITLLLGAPHATPET